MPPISRQYLLSAGCQLSGSRHGNLLKGEHAMSPGRWHVLGINSTSHGAPVRGAPGAKPTSRVPMAPTATEPALLVWLYTHALQWGGPGPGTVSDLEGHTVEQLTQWESTSLEQALGIGYRMLTQWYLAREW